MGKPDTRPVGPVSLARRLRDIFRESIERGSRAGVYPDAAKTSRETIVSGRVAQVVTAIRGRMGGKSCLGLSVRVLHLERPLQGRIMGAAVTQGFALG